MRITIVLALVLVACKGDPDARRNAALVETAKACTSDAELSCPRPILSVASLRASQAYFRDALGFKVDWDHGDPANFGAVSRGDAQLFMCEGCQGQPGSWTMIFSRDVDKLYDDLRARGALVRMPPTDMPWGLREMHVADLDGNILRFACSDQ